MPQIFKSPLEQARSLDITPDVDSFFAKYPKKENETFDDYDERVYSSFANEFGTSLKRDALNDIYDRALKKGYFGTFIDDDYERAYGPVDNEEKYKSYLKWKENN